MTTVFFASWLERPLNPLRLNMFYSYNSRHLPISMCSLSLSLRHKKRGSGCPNIMWPPSELHLCLQGSMQRTPHGGQFHIRWPEVIIGKMVANLITRIKQPNETSTDPLKESYPPLSNGPSISERCLLCRPAHCRSSQCQSMGGWLKGQSIYFRV